MLFCFLIIEFIILYVGVGWGLDSCWCCGWEFCWIGVDGVVCCDVCFIEVIVGGDVIVFFF